MNEEEKAVCRLFVDKSTGNEIEQTHVNLDMFALISYCSSQLVVFPYVISSSNKISTQSS
jgi:hypothetical protein